jgi:hypothetical protein
MTENPYRDDLSRFCVTFVRAVIAWNLAEDAAKRILSSVSEGSIGVIAAVSHLGSRGLDDALLTVADYWNDPETPNLQEIADHITHLVGGLGVIRGYRNFYVHSLISAGTKNDSTSEFVGILSATEAKGRYAWINQQVTTVELDSFMAHCTRLKDYGNAIAANVQKRNALAPPLPRPQPLASLEKPLWPPLLKKNRSYLIERPPPPKPSRKR